MKAIIQTRYCQPEKLDFAEVTKPRPRADEVLVKINAASLNAADFERMTGKSIDRIFSPFKPRNRIPGSDFAGIVEGTGRNCTLFKSGDEVIGDSFESGMGALAEYICVPETALVPKPHYISFEDASTLPQSGLLAFQAMRKYKITPGHKVLINGAGGGIGTFAIEIAKYFGAEVWAVDSSEKAELMKRLGADHIIDYEEEDFTQSGLHFDLILDAVASHSVIEYMNVLSDSGKCLIAGGKNLLLLMTLLNGKRLTKGTDKNVDILMWEQYVKDDFNFYFRMIDEEGIKPVIDKIYPLRESPKALRYLMDGHAKGKIIIKPGL